MYIEMEMLSAIKNVYKEKNKKQKLTHNVDKGSSLTMQKDAHTHTHTRTHARTHAHTHTHTHTRTHVRTHAHTQNANSATATPSRTT